MRTVIRSAAVLLLAVSASAQSVVRTGDPYTRGFKDADFPRVIKLADNVYSSEWVAALKTAEAMRVDRYVPGHGFTEEPKVSREELVNYRKAVEAVIAEVKRLHAAGVSVEEAVKQANFGEYATWSIAKQQSAVAVRKVYEELEGTLK